MKGKVDILDLINIEVYPGMPTQADPAPIRVEVTALDKTKNVIFDTDALRVMNERITDRARQIDIRDPKLMKYVEEFIGRFVSELGRHDLVVLEDAPDSPDDPYATVRKQYERFSRN